MFGVGLTGTTTKAPAANNIPVAVVLADSPQLYQNTPLNYADILCHPLNYDHKNANIRAETFTWAGRYFLKQTAYNRVYYISRSIRLQLSSMVGQLVFTLVLVFPLYNAKGGAILYDLFIASILATISRLGSDNYLFVRIRRSPINNRSLVLVARFSLLFLAVIFLARNGSNIFVSSVPFQVSNVAIILAAGLSFNAISFNQLMSKSKDWLAFSVRSNFTFFAALAILISDVEPIYVALTYALLSYFLLKLSLDSVYSKIRIRRQILWLKVYLWSMRRVVLFSCLQVIMVNIVLFCSFLNEQDLKPVIANLIQRAMSIVAIGYRHVFYFRSTLSRSSTAIVVILFLISLGNCYMGVELIGIALLTCCYLAYEKTVTSIMMLNDYKALALIAFVTIILTTYMAATIQLPYFSSIPLAICLGLLMSCLSTYSKTSVKDL